MRLGTLARKISITPSKLTTFLESQKVDLSSGTNTKLSEEEIALILEHYQKTLETETPEEEPAEAALEIPAPVPELKKAIEDLVVEPIEEIEAKAEKENIEEIVEVIDNEDSTKKEEKKASKTSESFVEIALPHELEEAMEPTMEDDGSVKEIVAEEIVAEEIVAEEIIEEEADEEEYIPQIPDDLDPEIESYVERLAYDTNIKIIKPPKVKLQGLTVKGKIDLPEPKAASETVEESKEEKRKAFDPDEIITTTGPKRDRKRKPKNYKGKKFNSDYNPVEAARKKKEWEEKKRLEQEEKRKKKAKAKHYNKIVKPIAMAPAVKKKPKKVVAKKKQKEQQPTGNVLQRFWRWMNT